MSIEVSKEHVEPTEPTEPTKQDGSTQADLDNPVLLNQYLFNKICDKVTDSFESNRIRCDVCIIPFNCSDDQYVLCRQCSKLFHYDCGTKSELRCPVCRHRKTSSTLWFTVIKKGQDLHTIILNSLSIKENLKSIINYNDMPRNMVPTLEAHYKGITQKINDVFNIIDKSPCTTKALKSSMELSNYLMSKCDEIDEAHKNIMRYEEMSINRLKKLIRKESDLDNEINEAKRQSEILEGCKTQFQITLDALEKHVNVEKKTLANTGNVKDRVKEWDNELENIKNYNKVGTTKHINMSVPIPELVSELAPEITLFPSPLENRAEYGLFD
jgi:hypothetical protein